MIEMKEKQMSLIKKEIREIEQSQKKSQNIELKETEVKINKVLTDHISKLTKKKHIIVNT